MRRRRIRLRFYFILLVLMAAAAAITVLVLSRSSEITTGTMTLNASVHPIIVREEKVMREEVYGKVVFFAMEGEQVTADTKIAEAFKWGFKDNILQSFLDLRHKIKDYQVNTINEGVIDPELVPRDDAIMRKTSQICDIVDGKDQADLLLVERELRAMLEERREFLKGKTQPDTKLSAMYDQEQEFLTSMESWKRDIKAVEAGTLSFYFDGYEESVNKDTIGDVSPLVIDRVIRGVGASSYANETEKPFYRVVNTQKWYCMIPYDKKANVVLVLDEIYQLIFDGIFDRSFDAKVIATNVVDSETMAYVLEINADMGPFINIRHAKATISKNITGVKVPIRYVKDIDGQKGVYVGTQTNKRFVPVEIMGVDKGFTFIRSVNKNEPLQAGMFVSPR